MQSSLFIGATGLKTHSAGMHTLANNLANVSTVGYKQQSLLFEDLMYTQNPVLGSAWGQVWNQTGMGAQVGDVRTLFSVEGAFETTNMVTDLAISGRGFFQVTGDDKTYYTRAGNFHFNKEGLLNDPTGFTLSGFKVVDGQVQNTPQPIKLDLNSEGFLQNPPRATDAVTAFFNLGFTTDSVSDPVNPAFSLLQAWDGTADPPLGSGQAGYSQAMRLYDSSGKTLTATIHFDSTNLGVGDQRVYEFIVTIPPGSDGSAAAGTEGAGLLMSGTLTFSAAGELLDMSAFSPNGSDYKDLNNWTPSAMVNGLPQVAVRTAGGENLNFTLNLGVTAPGGWENAPVSAAAVGADVANLPSMGAAVRDGMATTSLGTSSSSTRYKQSGYGLGSLTGMTISPSGEIVASYSNGQDQILYQIPLFRFTSEDGLYHEGSNHYSMTPACGEVEYGVAGTENYGKINAHTLEQSNVDMAREMTSMIIIQRGFQMNSKAITTTDSMLQKALELKR